MLKRWQSLLPFVKLFRVHLKWMVLGSLCGLIAVVSVIGLLALSGWFISAAAFAGLTVATAQLFNFFTEPAKLVLHPPGTIGALSPDDVSQRRYIKSYCGRHRCARQSIFAGPVSQHRGAGNIASDGGIFMDI